jgi:hypothetical protein
MTSISKSLVRNMLRATKAIAAVVTLTLALAPGCGTGPAGLEPLDTARGPVLAGRVTADGGPLAAATVRLEPVTGGLPASVAAELEQARAGAETAAADGAAKSGSVTSGAIRFAATDADGRYVFADVAPGQYLLTANGRNHLAGSAPTVITDPGFSTTGAETTFVDIALVPTGTIGGRALLATEALHAGTVVYVEGTSVVAVTRQDGEYVLRDVPVGPRDVKAMRDGYRAAATTATLTAAGDSVRATELVLGIDSNLPPVVTIQGPALIDIYSSIVLDATATDPDGTIVRYQWDFEDDGIFDTSSATTAFVSHFYQDEGVHRPKLRVTDDKGAVAYAMLRIDAVAAVYVATSGTDANPGTRTAPVATIVRAYQVAANLTESIGLRLAAGSYAPPATLLNHPLTGGYDPATWTRTAGSRSVLAMGGQTLVASGLSETGFTGIEVRATAPGADGNSIAMLITASSDLYFGDCRFVAVAALPGAAGASGAAGVAIPGQAGTTPSNCPGSSCVLAGGTTLLPNVGWGGWGGAPSLNPTAGTAGTGGASGGAAGFQNTANLPPTGGQNGGNAAPGSATSGAHGTAAVWTGSFSGIVWQPGHGSDGGDGQTSVGGGGGGGGGGSYTNITLYSNYFGGGGGAGGVSTGGVRGLGGRAGGSSFAVVTVLAENSYVSFTGCEFVSGSAGNGGNGGSGGAAAAAAPGGNGGAGMPYTGQEWNGGDGGRGGNSAASGSGGGGGGGAGGLSYAVYVTGFAEPTFSASTFQFGAAGSGGLGGIRGGTASRAPNGPNGSAGALYDDVQ